MTDSGQIRTLTLTADDEQALADVLGDAYAYRLGDNDPNEPDALDPTDAEAMARLSALAERLGIKPTP